MVLRKANKESCGFGLNYQATRTVGFITLLQTYRLLHLS